MHKSVIAGIPSFALVLFYFDFVVPCRTFVGCCGISGLLVSVGVKGFVGIVAPAGFPIIAGSVPGTLRDVSADGWRASPSVEDDPDGILSSSPSRFSRNPSMPLSLVSAGREGFLAVLLGDAGSGVPRERMLRAGMPDSSGGGATGAGLLVREGGTAATGVLAGLGEEPETSPTNSMRCFSGLCPNTVWVSRRNVSSFGSKAIDLPFSSLRSSWPVLKALNRLLNDTSLCCVAVVSVSALGCFKACSICSASVLSVLSVIFL